MLFDIILIKTNLVILSLVYDLLLLNLYKAYD